MRFQRPDGEENYKTPPNYLPIKLDTSVGVGTNETASSDMDHLGMGDLFDYTKPKTLIQHLIKMRCFLSKDDIICDFFAGSSTTAAAVMELNAEDGGNRRTILVQWPEPIEVRPEMDTKAKERVTKALRFLNELGKPHNIAEIGKERLRREGRAIQKRGGLLSSLPDIGFRVFRLDDSGIQTPEPGQLLLERVKPDRSHEDIIFEMMLKWGLDLSFPVEKIEISGYPCYSVAGDALICCMDEGLTIEVVEAIAERGPDRVFMLDSILDDSLKLNALQIFKRVEERTQQKIDLRTV